MKPTDNQSNMTNANKATSGTNRQYDQAQGNRGAQLNPNRPSPKDDEMSQRIATLVQADMTVAAEIDPRFDHLLNEDCGD